MREYLRNELGDLLDGERDRAIVYGAISDLFLDTQHDEAFLEELAAIIAESPFSMDELDVIYADEVAPSLWRNLLSTAGEWAGFDVRWLAREASRYRHSRARRGTLLRRLRRWIVTAMTRDAWEDLRERVVRLR